MDKKSDSNKNRTYKPQKQSVTLTETLLPDLDNLEVGQEATITLRVRMVSKSQGSEYGEFEPDEDSYLVKEYGQAYADAQRKDRTQMRGRFEVLEAEEDDTESSVARRISELKKQGKTPAEAVRLAKAGA